MDRIKCKKCETVFYFGKDKIPENWVCRCGNKTAYIFIGILIEKSQTERTKKLLDKNLINYIE